MNKPVIGLMLGIGTFLYFAIVASMVSVKLNPDNVANQHQQQQAYGQLEQQELTTGTNNTTKRTLFMTTQIHQQKK